MCTIATAKVQRNYNCYNVYFNECLQFTKEQTYINCNNVIEISDSEFGKLIKDGKVHRLEGRIDELGLQLIAKGVKLSPEVQGRIKDLFE